MLKIDKGFSLPERRARGELSRTVIALDVGDSFLVPADAHATSIYATARRAGIKVTCRRTDAGLRCWRLA